MTFIIPTTVWAQADTSTALSQLAEEAAYVACLDKAAQDYIEKYKGNRYKRGVLKRACLDERHSLYKVKLGQNNKQMEYLQASSATETYIVDTENKAFKQITEKIRAEAKKIREQEQQEQQ